MNELDESAAVDAAGMMIAKFRDGPSSSTDIARAALAAALPHLAQPSKSDETDRKRALAFIDIVRRQDKDGLPYFQADWLADLYASALTAVRAEASAAERESIVKWADTWVNAPVNIADALAKIAALQRDEAHIMKQYQRVSDENAALREALRPFADAHFYYNDAGKPDDLTTGIGGVTYGDFRRSVSVLAALEMSGGRSSET